ncbi:hypothetical protein SEA_BILLNYE_187 [Streptomyces phage BillNye]|uniref:Uncharacterized protein n=1 Tax=Streptomyces phage BillNye TaxID=2079426 RepID=A0A2L1IVZ0_9CAUD|nr:hypothetical protein FDJ30_gp074 [Streptomyces phage BillNye]AVD99359.1 hypothetical protein SEA_BILLNYE_187 [Streptomyces phage BillNye]
MSYTVEQIQDAVRAFDSAGDWHSDGEFYDEIMWARKDKAVHLDSLGVDAFHVDRVGGSEGDGDHMEVIFRVGDQLFRKAGYHNSWDSNDWDTDYGLDEVEAFEKTVTDYRAI